MPNVWNPEATDLIADPANAHEVDPISRIEGHLGIKVVVDPDTNLIVDANAHGNLWRGFENFLLGRAANDAITFVQRICGVCPVPHGMTSTYAVDAVLGYSRNHITFKTDAQGYGVPAKAVLIRNLVLASEFLMSSITHFYHLVAPSYVQGPAIPPWIPYFSDSQYSAPLLASNHGSGAVASSAGDGIVPDANPATMRLWDAVIISYVRALKIRRLTFEAGALFAGRMPMTSCYVGGGVTNDGTEDLTDRCDTFETIMQEVAKFILNEYVPIVLALGVLYPDYDNTDNGGAGFGAGLGRFLSWGAFPNLDANDTLTLPGGVYDANGDVANFTVANKAEVISKFLAGGTNAVPTNLTEDIANARYEVAGLDYAAYGGTYDGDGNPLNDEGTVAYPGAVSRTAPNRANGYTYMKAPRWAGWACEVGPFARLAVAGIYPVDGSTLSSWAGLEDHYGLYLNSSEAFNANAVAPTIVAGLSNTNLDGSFSATGGVLGAVVGYILAAKGGLSTMDRLRARGLESLVLVQRMIGTMSVSDTGVVSFASNGWIHELKTYTGDGVNANDTSGSTWTNKAIPVGVKQGWGGTEAPRGALMHQCTINNGKITKYQCIVPTTWNGSPKDAGGENGAIEAACIGTRFEPGTYVTTGGGGGDITTTVGGVEVLRIAQSFDPCIACAVH
jgi:Ni,Fe-hydrogenase I large subunit